MLIQRARPRLRPPGNLVYRVNRKHRLAGDARAVVLFGGGEGLARELITGFPLRQTAGAAVPGVTSDGAGLNAGTGGAHNQIDTVTALDLWTITGDLTVAWRGFVGNTTSGGGVLGAGAFLASNVPYIFSHNSNFAAQLYRGSATGFRGWDAASPGSTQFVHYDTTLTKSVSHVSEISTAPTFYFEGIASGAPSSFGGGSGATAGGAQVLRSAFAAQTDPWHTSNIAIAGARIWSADEHLLFHLDPYGILEEAPRWYFRGAGGSPDIGVSLTGIALTASSGSVTEGIAVAASGSAATSAAGSPAAALGEAVTGEAATVAAGTAGSGITAGATGVSGTTAAGSVAGALGALALGVALAASAGTATSGIGMAVTGATAMTVSAGSVAYTIGFTLTGAASTAAGGSLGTTGGDTTAARSLTGIRMTALPGNVRVTGGTPWTPQVPRAATIATADGNTLPPPPRLTGNLEADTRAMNQWLGTFYDQFVKAKNVLGRIDDHETRIAALEADSDT